MNILITGGCGFIGTNLISKLEGKPYNLRILDNLSASAASKSDIDSKKLVIGDIRDEKLADELTKGVDVIVHLAAHTSVVGSVKDPKTDCDINIIGTLNLLRACVKNSVRRFIFASSNAAVGVHTPPIDEEKLPIPLSPYGASKLACEGYCSAFYRTFGIETVILRFSNVYGPNCLHKSSVVAKFIKALLNSKSLSIYGDGTQTRDFVYVGDICDAILLCLTKKDISGETFQIGTGIEVAVIELAKRIIAIDGRDTKLDFKPPRKGEIFRNFSDIEKSNRVLGFKPRVMLDEGLRETYKWFQALELSALEIAKETGDE